MDDTRPHPRRHWRLPASILVLALGIGVAVRHGPGRDPSELAPDPYERQFAVLDTYASLKFWAPTGKAEAAADAVAAELLAFHELINIFDETSELSRLNLSAAAEAFVCSPALWRALTAARRAYEDSGGAFDVSVGPLMKLWGFHRRRNTLPSDAEVASCLASVGLDKADFDDEAKTVRFTAPGMSLDLGGIAKGYALDLVSETVRTQGVRRGLIDLGGNIRCLDEPPPGRTAYSIGVRHPFANDELLGTIDVLDCSIATSGNYEQFVELEGKKVSHIVDPRTGRPVANVASVTVVTPAGVDSDVFSTAIFVGGDAVAETLCATRQRTGVLRVELDETGKSVIHKSGWVWEGFPD